MALQVWLPLNGNLNNQGLTNVTVTNNGATVDNNGKIGKCYSFSASSAKITNTLSSSVTSAVGTMSCWVKFNSFPSSGAWYCLMQLGTAGGFANCRLGIYMQYQTGIVVCINGSSDSNLYTHSLTTNKWYHLCTTFDGTIVRLYIDGVEVWNKTAVVGSYTTAASTLFVGGTNNYYFKGYMNDVRYYSTALSPKEIEILSRGLVCHYPLSDSAIEATTNLVTSISAGGQTTINGDMVTTSGENKDTYFFLNTSEKIINGQTYTLSCDVSGIASGEHWRFSFYGDPAIDLYNGHNEITFTAKKDTSGTQLILDDTYRPIINNPTTFSHFQLEKKDHATLYAGLGGTRSGNPTVYDTSGYQYNGEGSNNLTISTDSARYRHSTVFDVNSDTITPPAVWVSNTLVDKLSVSIWFKTNTLNSTAPNMWSLGENGFARIRLASATSIWYYININGTTKYNTYTVSKTLTDNKWHHTVFIWDSGTVKMYLDGEQVGTDSWSSIGTALKMGNVYWHLAGYNASSESFIGNLSDFRIYATALSADDIKELYDTVASVANNGTLLTRGEFIET